MNRKIVLIIIFAIICIFFIINFNTISGILFPKDTYIEVYVEESSAIKGGIININVRDSEEGKIIDSEEDINVTLIDKKGNSGSDLEPTSCSIYRYGGGNDKAWEDLSAYGDFTIYVNYPGETGYNPSNITKNITVHVIEEKSKSHQSSSNSKSNSHAYYDMLAKSQNPSAFYSGEDEDYYIYTYHSNLPYGDNHIRINKNTGEVT